MKRLVFSVSLLLCASTCVNTVYANCWKEGPPWARVKVCDSENPGKDIRREGQKAIEGIERGGQRAREAAGDFIERATIPPGAREYISYLEKQAQGREKELPPRFLAIIAPHYVKAPLSMVRYAEGIDTVHGQAITVGNRIYFPSPINLNDRQHVAWMLHELEHVSQYAVHGGVTPFLIKYAVQGGLEIGRHGFNVHDSIPLEDDAENKARRILVDVLAMLERPRRDERFSSRYPQEGEFDRGRPSYREEYPSQPNRSRSRSVIPEDHNLHFFCAELDNSGRGRNRCSDRNFTFAELPDRNPGRVCETLGLETYMGPFHSLEGVFDMRKFVGCSN